MLLARYTTAVFVLALFLPARAETQERLCDSAFENCRTPVLDLIKNETVGIDVAFWFMTDTRYSSALIDRWKLGVRVRVLMDTRANSGNPGNATVLQRLQDAGIPMREKTSGGILHWKMMLFAGQNVVQFSGANYSSSAFVPAEPYANYVDEAIYFTDDAAIVNSFKTKYDDVWTKTSGYSNYANVTTLERYYPTFTIHGDLNFPPDQNFATRSVSRYNAENTGIDAIIYRITDRRHTDALIAARGRGVAIRVISEPFQYRDPTRLWHSWNIDRLYMAGVQIRHRAHDGLTHEKLTILRGQAMTVLGSSNWTSPSANSQLEHNYFTKKAHILSWARDHFDRKWNNSTGIAETKPFAPLPPDWPSYVAPVNASSSQPLSSTLTWYAGLWAHKYDIYFGTTPEPPLLVADLELGPSERESDYVKYPVSNLLEGTTYYWKITSKTMANMARTGPVWSFHTQGTGSPPTGTLPSGWQSQDIGAVGIAGSASASNGTFTVSGAGADIWGAADAFHFAYRSLSGDGTIVARVASINGSQPWTKMGVMMRSSVAPQSAYAFMLVSTGKGLAFQRRTQDGISATHTSGGSGTAPYWVRLARVGNTITASVSASGSSWTVVGSDSFSMPSTVLVGLVGHSNTVSALATATYDNVSVTTTESAPTAPSGWQATDVGAVGVAGSTSESSGTFTLKGAGADVWGTADAFHYAYQSLSGDGSIVARVASVSGSEAWTKVGVMVRGSLDRGSAHAFMLVSAGKGLAFQRRTADGGTSTNTSGGGGGAPRWVRLTRAGNNVTAATSFDGVSWTTVGGDTIALPATALVGLAVTSHDASALATGAFDSVSIESSTPTASLPAGWDSGDIGAVGVAGSGGESGGTFTVKGAGADIWGTADAFHYLHGTLAGDGAIVARVASLSGSHDWTKAGVMIRESLEPGSAHAFMLLSTAKGPAFQRRTATGGISTHTAEPSDTASSWVKLDRNGAIITASLSTDGASWSVVGSDTISMVDAVHVGFAVASHDTARLATATFDNVEITTH